MHHWFFMLKMHPMSGCDIRVVFTSSPRDSTLQYKKSIQLWNNFPSNIIYWKGKYQEFVLFKPRLILHSVFSNNVFLVFKIYGSTSLTPLTPLKPLNPRNPRNASSNTNFRRRYIIFKPKPRIILYNIPNNSPWRSLTRLNLDISPEPDLNIYP